MKQLEGFQCATELDLNMGYFTIRLSTAIQDMMMTVTKFGKFRYNCLPMDMCVQSDILKYKLDNLLDDIKGVKTHINGISVLIKESLYNNI